MANTLIKEIKDLFYYPINLLKFLFRGAMKFLTLYFLGIGFFASTYMLHPEDFHHSTSHLEPEIVMDKIDYLHALSSDIESYLNQFIKDKQILHMQIQYEGDKLNQYNLFFSINEGAVINSPNYYTEAADLSLPNITPINYDTIHKQNIAWEYGHFAFKARFNYLLSKEKIKNGATLNLPSCDPSSNKGWFGFYDPKQHLKNYFCTDNQGSLKLQVLMSPSTIKKYEHLNAAMNGKGQYASGNHWRMIYFSVTTMTTLGYGDIVPLTNKMRMAVAFQTIFGIILLGAFLNSIASSRKN